MFFSREMLPFGVKVSIITPGFFKTELTNPELQKQSVKHSWEQASEEVQKSYGAEFYRKSEYICPNTTANLQCLLTNLGTWSFVVCYKNVHWEYEAFSKACFVLQRTGSSYVLGTKSPIMKPSYRTFFSLQNRNKQKEVLPCEVFLRLIGGEQKKTQNWLHSPYNLVRSEAHLLSHSEVSGSEPTIPYRPVFWDHVTIFPWGYILSIDTVSSALYFPFWMCLFIANCHLHCSCGLYWQSIGICIVVIAYCRNLLRALSSLWRGSSM